MLDSFELKTAAHWKGLAHPLRVGILERLKNGAMTNEELAKSLGVESGKLYFHTKQLLTAGLIERAGSRQNGPITEKLYRAVAKKYVACQ
jgi:DNA-binding transcriptional ArsR family regulator